MVTKFTFFSFAFLLIFLKNLKFKLCFKKMHLQTLLTYSTVKEINIPNPWVAIVYRFTQTTILCYLIGYELILNRAFQTFEHVTSTVTTKVKGIGLTSPLNLTKENFYTGNHNVLSVINTKYTENDKKNFKIFDTSDYIVPPNEYNSLFIMTNYVKTKQSPGVCEEEPKRGKCTRDEDCLDTSILINTWHGLPTGKCIQSKHNNQTSGVCEINGWCPIEYEAKNSDKNLLINTLSYTIFIKNDIEFKKFNRKERNIFEGITNEYISKCKFDPTNDKYCPVFELGSILERVEPDAQERHQMLLKGGVIEIGIEWDCNYDFYAKKCFPQYTFSRMDIPFKQTSTSSGFNFRFANKYRQEDNKEYRDLYKAYGLRIVISVTGRAGKFHIIPLMNAVGSGLGVLSISVILADCLVKNFSSPKQLPEPKYQKVQTDESELSIKQNGVTISNTI